MNGPVKGLGVAVFLIRSACRALPDVDRVEREWEWTAEAEAIAGDAETRLPTGRALWFALSLLLNTRAVRGAQAARARPATRCAGLFDLDAFLAPIGVALAVAAIFFTVYALLTGAGAQSLIVLLGVVSPARSFWKGYLERRAYRPGVDE